MSVTLHPVRVATGVDEEGVLVFDDERRLVAILTISPISTDGASGHWFLEAGFGRLEGRDHPTFADLLRPRRGSTGVSRPDPDSRYSAASGSSPVSGSASAKSRMRRRSFTNAS